MVKNGQSRETIQRVEFATSALPGWSIEALEYSDVLRRVGAQHLASPRRTSFYQLTLVQQGKLRHEIDFEQFEISRGMLALVRPDQVQRMMAERGCTATMLLFEPIVLTQAMPGLQVRRITPVLEAGEGILRAMEGLVEEYRVGHEHPDRIASEAIVLHQLLALLYQLQRQSLATGVTREGRGLFERFQDLLEQDFGKERSVAGLAAKLGCSAKTLDRACLASAGETPKQLIDKRVVLEAKRILSHSKVPVKQLAGELGFSETTNFVKYFRRYTGESPTEFRRRAQVPRG